MGIQGIAVIGLALVLLAVVGYGLFTQKKSAGIGLAALVVAFLAAGGGWHAWAESRSVPVTVGYVVVLLISLGSAARQFVGKPAGGP